MTSEGRGRRIEACLTWSVARILAREVTRENMDPILLALARSDQARLDDLNSNDRGDLIHSDDTEKPACRVWRILSGH